MTERDAPLERVREVFEEFGHDDAFYAALTRGGYGGNRWDAESFFETGRKHIAEVMAYLERLGLAGAREQALDFGCGAGRLAQALAEYYQQVTGVDIAQSMAATARAFNRHGERVQYLVNTAPDLALFESGSFDLVYTSKVLQHMPPPLQEGYIREFIRIIRNGGVAVFQVRNGPRVEPGTLRAWLYTLNRRHLRRALQRLRRRPGYEMHYLARSRVEELVAAAGGRLIDVVDLSRSKPNKSLRYCITK